MGFQHNIVGKRREVAWRKGRGSGEESGVADVNFQQEDSAGKEGRLGLLLSCSRQLYTLL
jgi:hypothetical protein